MSPLAVIIAQRLWQAVAGLGTALLVIRHLTPELQGWYYGFLGIGALHTLFDLGLSVVLVQLAARLSADTRLQADGSLHGAAAGEFHALLHRAVRTYLGLAVAFTGFLLLPGASFFVLWGGGLSGWQMPWLTLALALGAGLAMLPLLALLEGSGFIREVYALRLAQGVAGALLCWLALVAGGGLWAAAMPALAAATVQAFWLGARWRPLLGLAARRPPASLSWRAEVWPLQWRVGAGWLAGYLLAQIYTPILFATHGPVAAGQMGLSLAVANTLALVAFSTVTHIVPAMTKAARATQWSRMDRLFANAAVIAAALFFAGALAVLIVLQVPVALAAAQRLLPPSILAALFAAVFLTHLQGALSAQLRAYRREPLVWINLAGAALTIAGALAFVSTHAASGVVLVLLCVQAIVVLPASLTVWRRSNHIWRVHA